MINLARYMYETENGSCFCRICKEQLPSKFEYGPHMERHHPDIYIDDLDQRRGEVEHEERDAWAEYVRLSNEATKAFGVWSKKSKQLTTAYDMLSEARKRVREHKAAIRSADSALKAEGGVYGQE